MLGAVEVVLLLLAVLALFLTPFLVIAGTVDAVRQPEELWAPAGYHRRVWVWQFVGLLVAPAGLVFSAGYFLRVRRRLSTVATGLALAQLPAADSEPYRSPVPDAGVRLRPPLLIPLLTLLAALVGTVLPYLVVPAGGSPHHLLPAAIGWGVAGAVVLPTEQVWFGITVYPTHLVVRGLRRRSIPWRWVHMISDESRFGGRRVVVGTVEGWRRLRAPVTTLGIGRRRYDRDLRLLEDAWLADQGYDPSAA